MMGLKEQETTSQERSFLCVFAVRKIEVK